MGGSCIRADITHSLELYVSCSELLSYKAYPGIFKFVYDPVSFLYRVDARVYGNKLQATAWKWDLVHPGAW